ncbi:cupin domain-containing protein [Goodfellowiella coeruleoviolacea]|uniref:Cupin domain-containing protein n=1 Tax=Goodfellowiella coeruleoviolacea TaxID=334858 RepID=A0AAE3GFN0_9PSEU|nr:cupin domain-containing protein [Goodfellowiella coeruleoviolacea]MCP2166454.1 Cupin domain-containing protein [Goodfellowiella coeruleoviolacea]
MSLTPVDLFASALRLRRDNQVHVEARRMSGDETNDWMVAAFHVETDADVHADHWEMHPNTEEVVAVLAGAVRVYLRPDHADEPEQETRLGAGEAFVVPRGRWHRLELDAPSDLMSIGVRRGTRLEARASA